MFTNTNTNSQTSNANPYSDKLAQPEQTQVLELSEQDLEQVSGGILPFFAAVGTGIAIGAGTDLFNRAKPIVSGVVRDLNNNSDRVRIVR